MIAKKYFGLLAAVAVVAAAGWNYQQNKQSEGLSELVLANVEALATGEDFEVTCGSQEDISSFLLSTIFQQRINK